MGTVTDGANGMRPGRGSALILARLVTYAPVAGPSAEHAAPRDPRCRRAGTMTGTDPKQTESRGSASSSLLIVFQSASFSLRAFRPPPSSPPRCSLPPLPSHCLFLSPPVTSHSLRVACPSSAFYPHRSPLPLPLMSPLRPT